jgi:hypothetical protein
MTFKGENSGDSTMLVMDPAGGTDLYFAGTKEAETESGYLKATNAFQIAATTNVTGILDEDAMGSDSAVSLVTQQSVKAYIDNDTGGTVSTHAALTTTHGVSGTLVGTSDTQTLSAKTLTSPIINTILTATGKTGATFTEDGAATLRNNELTTLTTTAFGVDIGNGTNSCEFQVVTGTGTQLTNLEHGTNFILRSEDVGGTPTNLFIGDPDGAVNLYYDGTKTIETISGGVKVTGTASGSSSNANASLIIDDSGASYLSFTSDGVSEQGLAFADAGSTAAGQLTYTHSTDNLQLHSTNTIKMSGGANTMFSATSAGAVELYHAGTKVFETTSDGFLFGTVPATGGYIHHDGTTLDIYSYGPGDNFTVRGLNGSSSAKTMISADPDDTAELYYAGTEIIRTRADGISVGPAATPLYLTSDVSWSYIKNADSQNGIVFSNLSGTTMCYMRDATAVELYYNGTKEFETVSGGASVTNGDLFIPGIKSGATQVAAGAAANELWKTASHATLPDNVVMIGV